MCARGSRLCGSPTCLTTFAQIAVSLLNDFALVYLLAPVAPLKGAWAAKTPLQQMLDRLPAHVLQSTPVGRRPYTVAQRAACFGVKAVQYGVVGFCMGILGTQDRGLTLHRLAVVNDCVF